MKFLFVHPSCELYGSDRSFAAVVESVVNNVRLERSSVLLPCEGPLMHLPVFKGMELIFSDFWVLRRKGLLRAFSVGLLGNIFRIFHAYKQMIEYDCVYINTVIVFDYIVAARFLNKPVVIHVREIPVGVEMELFRRLLVWSKAKCIFNSVATKNAFNLPTTQESHVVYNGFNGPDEVSPPKFTEIRAVKILLIGRINSWKGQSVLVDAIGLLSKTDLMRVEVLIVGGVYGDQTHYREGLEERISKLGLNSIIKILPFESDPSKLYQWADLVVVPSTKPEPFGRVAIEAMSFARPVIGANHGGLREIIAGQYVGDLVTPNSPVDLSKAISRYLNEPQIITAKGLAARERFLMNFTQAASDKCLFKIIKQYIN